MHSITINISNDKLLEKATWLLEHFSNDGLEIVSKEDVDDLKLLKATRKEKSVPFDEYLNAKKIEPAYRLRAGDYRILFDVSEDAIEIGRVLHRKESYK